MGFDQGGLLTEAITTAHCAAARRDRKAHPDIFNILLQVMDHGTLTDNNGRKGRLPQRHSHRDDQRGAETLNRPAIGFANERVAGDEMAEIRRMFTPEFRNRLDAIIPFAGLSREIILRVVDKFLMQLEDQLHERRVAAVFTEKLRDHLAKEGFDPLMGARPMQRLIQDTIRRALATNCCSASWSTAAMSRWTWTTRARWFSVSKRPASLPPTPPTNRKWN